MKIKILIVVGLLLLLSAGAALAQTGGGGGSYDLSWSQAANGGGVMFSSGGTYQLGGTIAQAGIGPISGGTYTLNGGFWAAALPYSQFVPVMKK